MTDLDHDDALEHDDLDAKIIALRPAPVARTITPADLSDAVLCASLASVLMMDGGSTRQELLDAVKFRLRSGGPLGAVRDLAEGELAWKGLAERRQHRLQVVLGMLRGGDVDGAERYLVEVLEEEVPRG